MPKKICNQLGCNTLIPMSERYCPAHKREAKRFTSEQYNKYKRNKSHQKFYSSREWKQVREAVMQEHGGLCVECMKLDLIIKADVVDHIIPLEKDYSKRLEISNLQPLCHSCHNRKTAQDKELYGEGA